MIPSHGGRIVLRFVSADKSLVYSVELYAPGASWRTRATVDLLQGGGEVTFDAVQEGAAPPAWLLQAARSLLRAVWRSKPQTWPRRVTRWRAEPAPAAG